MPLGILNTEERPPGGRNGEEGGSLARREAWAEYAETQKCGLLGSCTWFRLGCRGVVKIWASEYMKTSGLEVRCFIP